MNSLLIPMDLQLFGISLEPDVDPDKNIENMSLEDDDDIYDDDDDEGFEGADDIFNDDEPDEDGEGEELDTSQSYGGSEDDEPEVDDPDEGDDKTDPKTNAIIREKALNKELSKRLAAAEEELAEKMRNDGIKQLAEELVDGGMDEEAAQKQAEREYARTERELQYEKRIDDLEFRSLAQKYPDIEDYREEIRHLAKRTGMTKEEIYLAKFQRLTRAERRTQAEQEAIYKARQKSKRKSGTKKSTGKDTTVLPPADERIYRMVVKNGHKLTRAEYADMHGINRKRR